VDARRSIYHQITLAKKEFFVTSSVCAVGGVKCGYSIGGVQGPQRVSGKHDEQAVPSICLPEPGRPREPEGKLQPTVFE
jgi:hypothetical protein